MGILVEPPPGYERSEEELKEVDSKIRDFNAKSLEHVLQMAKDDQAAAVVRRWVTVGLVSLLTVGGLAIAAWAMMSELTAASVAALVGVFAVLGIALFINPLQTIERDVVYRRWSDQILAGFYTQLADNQADLRAIRLASRNASKEFALLATAYTQNASHAADTIAKVVGATEAEEEEEEQAPTTITLSAIEDRTDAVGAAIEFSVEVAAPEDTVYTAEGLPAGLEIGDEKAATISGSPTTEGESTVVFTAKSESARQSVSATFTWTVTPAEKPEPEPEPEPQPEPKPKPKPKPKV